MNPEANELSIVVSDERTLPLLDDLVLSVSNAVPVGNHSRYTSYAGCFGLLHCHHEVPGEAGSQRTFPSALCFMRAKGMGRSSRQYFANFRVHRNHPWTL